MSSLVHLHSFHEVKYKGFGLLITSDGYWDEWLCSSCVGTTGFRSRLSNPCLQLCGHRLQWEWKMHELNLVHSKAHRHKIKLLFLVRLFEPLRAQTILSLCGSITHTHAATLFFLNVAFPRAVSRLHLVKKVLASKIRWWGWETGYYWPFHRCVSLREKLYRQAVRQAVAVNSVHEYK